MNIGSIFNAARRPGTDRAREAETPPPSRSTNPPQTAVVARTPQPPDPHGLPEWAKSVHNRPADHRIVRALASKAGRKLVSEDQVETLRTAQKRYTELEAVAAKFNSDRFAEELKERRLADQKSLADGNYAEFVDSPVQTRDDLWNRFREKGKTARRAVQSLLGELRPIAMEVAAELKVEAIRQIAEVEAHEREHFRQWNVDWVPSPVLAALVNVARNIEREIPSSSSYCQPVNLLQFCGIEILDAE